MASLPSTSTSATSESLKGRKAPKKWEEDGVDGGPSSIDVILNWLTTNGNFARWKGEKGGVSKQKLCSEIVGRLNEVGISHRNPNDVRTKLQDILNSYNKAQDWSAKTGEGIRAEDEEGAEATIKGKHYVYPIDRRNPFNND